MNNSNKIAQLFVKIRRAEWANDYETCLELIEDFKKKGKFIELENQILSKQERFTHKNSFNPQMALLKTVQVIENHMRNLSSEKVSLQYYPIKTDNLKAIIYRLDEYVFQLKGYLLNLELKEAFYKKVYLIASEINNIFPFNIPDNLEAKSYQWTKTFKGMRIATKIGDFGLFEMTGTLIGDSSSLQSIDNIAQIFHENLRDIEPELLNLERIRN